MNTETVTFEEKLLLLKARYKGRMAELGEKIDLSAQRLSAYTRDTNPEEATGRVKKDLEGVFDEDFGTKKDDSGSGLRRLEIEFQNMRVCFDFADDAERKRIMDDAREMLLELRGASSSRDVPAEAERDVVGRESERSRHAPAPPKTA